MLALERFDIFIFPPKHCVAFDPCGPISHYFKIKKKMISGQRLKEM